MRWVNKDNLKEMVDDIAMDFSFDVPKSFYEFICSDETKYTASEIENNINTISDILAGEIKSGPTEPMVLVAYFFLHRLGYVIGETAKTNHLEHVKK